jgi:hypothetical protein
MMQVQCDKRMNEFLQRPMPHYTALPARSHRRHNFCASSGLIVVFPPLLLDRGQVHEIVIKPQYVADKICQ